MNYIGRIKRDHEFIYIILAILFQAFSGIFAKYASLSVHSEMIFQFIINSYYILSIVCLVFQALIWQMALKRYDLSFAYPLVSLVNFVMLISSYVLFNENITIANIIGLMVISAGICLLFRGEAKK